MNAHYTISEREAILTALADWINQRPGLEFGNYGDRTSYRAELRSIGQDRQDAMALLAAVGRHESITAEMLKQAFKSAYSGRLSWVEVKPGKGWRLDYCMGQYWPTEYRRAACAVLAAALWYWKREHCMPQPDPIDLAAGGRGDRTYKGKSAGDWIRESFRKEFGKRMQRRWFD